LCRITSLKLLVYNSTSRFFIRSIAECVALKKSSVAPGYRLCYYLIVLPEKNGGHENLFGESILLQSTNVTALYIYYTLLALRSNIITQRTIDAAGTGVVDNNVVFTDVAYNSWRANSIRNDTNPIPTKYPRTRSNWWGFIIFGGKKTVTDHQAYGIAPRYYPINIFYFKIKASTSKVISLSFGFTLYYILCMSRKIFFFI